MIISFDLSQIRQISRVFLRPSNSDWYHNLIRQMESEICRQFSNLLLHLVPFFTLIWITNHKNNQQNWRKRHDNIQMSLQSTDSTNLNETLTYQTCFPQVKNLYCLCLFRQQQQELGELRYIIIIEITCVHCSLMKLPKRRVQFLKRRLGVF